MLFFFVLVLFVCMVIFFFFPFLWSYMHIRVCSFLHPVAFEWPGTIVAKVFGEYHAAPYTLKTCVDRRIVSATKELHFSMHSMQTSSLCDSYKKLSFDLNYLGMSKNYDNPSKLYLFLKIINVIVMGILFLISDLSLLC